MKTLVRSLFISAAFVGTAFAQTPTPAPKKAPTTEKAPAKAPADTKKPELGDKDVQEFLVFFNKFVDTVVAAKEDCAKLTKDTNALIDANQPMIKKIQQAKAENKDLPQAAKDKMMARVKEMMPAMQKCGGDPGFQAAMKRMEGDSKASAPPAKTPAKTEAPAKTAPTPTKK